MNKTRGSWALLCLTVGLTALPLALTTVRGQSRTPYTTWSDYGGSSDSMQYSALRQINGKILWEHDLNANPEGLPSVFEVNGRQHVAFTASYYASLDPGNISTFQGKVENQGYYVFALPK